MTRDTTQRLFLTSLAGLCVSYCVAALAFVATTPDIRLRGLIGGVDRGESNASQGFSVQLVDGETAHPGDTLLELGGVRTRTFVDFAQTPSRSVVSMMPTGLAAGFFAALPAPLDLEAAFFVFFLLDFLVATYLSRFLYI